MGSVAQTLLIYLIKYTFFFLHIIPFLKRRNIYLFTKFNFISYIYDISESESMAALSLLHTKLASENMRSEVADGAGIAKRYLAKMQRFGTKVWFN